MSSPLGRSLRIGGRIVRIAATLAWAALVYFLTVAWMRQGKTAAQSRWLQRTCRWLLPALGAQVEVSGPLPTRGLLISNHLSYLDIIVYGSVLPAVFVSKYEVKHWPVFGWMAQLAGTLFVRREKKSDVVRLKDEIAQKLGEQAIVIFFPEGTSSDGKQVLPFKSSLLEPAAQLAEPVTAGCLRYELAEGDVGQDICYWGDMTFGPHFVKLLGKKGLRARVQLSATPFRSADRKELTQQLQQAVIEMHGRG